MSGFMYEVKKIMLCQRGLFYIALVLLYNVPIDVDIKFDPNPISWTLKIPLILFHGHLLILLSG